MKLTKTMTSTVALAIIGFASAASAANLPITNAGFEYPAGDNVRFTGLDGSDPLVGWTKFGGGQIFNPGNNANAPEGSNSYLILEGIAGYDLGDGDIVQALDDVLAEGDYTLTVQVGENVAGTSSFGDGYVVQLGVMSGGIFTSLAEDNSTLTAPPNNGFLTSTVSYSYSAAAGDTNLGQYNRARPRRAPIRRNAGRNARRRLSIYP